MRTLGITAQKALLLLLSGVALAFTRSPSRAKRVLCLTAKEWGRLNREELYRAINRLYESKLIGFSMEAGGITNILLNREGKKVALRFQLDEMKIPHQKVWDKKWRVVLFDIPEEKKKLRDTLRTRLRQFGLLKLQKSVFVHPFACRDEIDFLIELYNARRYVRFIEADHIDNELHLKKRFNIL